MKTLPVIILGTGGHARVLIDALLLSPVNLLGTTDTNHQNQSLLGVPYLGGDEVIEKYSSNEICLVNGIGSISQPYLRKTIFKKFKNLGYRFINVIHPSSIIATDVKLGEGVQVMAGAIIQSGSEIGDNSIINTRTSVDHDCRIGQHIHLAPGSILCGNVCVEELGHVGAGAIILQSIRVGAQVLVDAGALVKSDIEGIVRDKGKIA